MFDRIIVPDVSASSRKVQKALFILSFYHIFTTSDMTRLVDLKNLIEGLTKALTLGLES